MTNNEPNFHLLEVHEKAAIHAALQHIKSEPERRGLALVMSNHFILRRNGLKLVVESQAYGNDCPNGSCDL